jgi:hypothetical protein
MMTSHSTGIPWYQPPSSRRVKGVLGLVDRGLGKTISISLWETEADMKTCEASGWYQQQLAKFKDSLAAPPLREA